MKTLRELYNAVNDLLPKRPFALHLTVWEHRNHDGGLDIEYSVWDGQHHHKGSTAAAALLSLTECPDLRSVVKAEVLDAIPLPVEIH